MTTATPARWFRRIGPGVVVIVLASAIAHLWCLKSRFYLDDFPAILFSDEVRDGRFLGSDIQTWTVLWYWVQAHASGYSAAVFHAGNWLLHTGCALMLLVVARDWLGSGKRGVALFAALLFAVHPLGSEIPNYARTQDLAWVTLFSLLAAWSVRRWVTGGGWRNGLWFFIGVTGATFSKGPGLFHAGMAVAVVAVLSMASDQWGVLRAKWRWTVTGLVLLVLLLWASGWWGRFGYGIQRWSEPRFAGHALTVCRVFWEFAWRAILPIHLSADHHIAETMVPSGMAWWKIPDRTALLAAAGMIGFLGAAGWLAWRHRTRVVGLGLLLFGLTMAFRVFFIVPEFMPEYRIYPGLPWFCLAAAVVIAGVWHRLRILPPVVPAIVLLTLLTGLSAKRSFLWHDIHALMADVLAQYPTQSRAVWVLQAEDGRAGNWKAVIERQSREFPAADRALQEANRRLGLARQLPTGHHALAVIGAIGYYARALAAVRNPQAGLDVLLQLEAGLQAVQPPPQEVHWALFRHAKGLVLESAGDYAGAIDCLELEDGTVGERRRDLERVKAKLAAKAAGQGG